jgi:transglutaminase-like putative cysteine protease
MTQATVVHTPAGGRPEPSPLYLQPTAFIDSDAATIQAFAEQATHGARTPREKAVELYYAIRDGIRYDPFTITLEARDYVASNILPRHGAWCIQKGVLLAAAARAVGIHAAIGLSDVTNHLTTEKLRERMGGSTLFVDHGYAVLYLNGKWVKAAPAFNIELCTRFGVLPTEFDGTEDAVFQEYDTQNRRHMEYLADHGMWSDLPLTRIIEDLKREYPPSTYGEDTAPENFEDGKRLS